MKKVLFFLLSLIYPFFVQAQHTVSGIVSDHKDSAVAGVSVYIPEFEKFDETKAGGTYLLKNVRIGLVHIQYSKQGYQTVVQSINTADSALVLNIRLMPSASHNEEIMIASNRSTLPGNLPYPVHSLNLSEYRKSGAVNVVQGLAMQPSIDRVSTGNGIGRPVIRGLSYNRVALHEFGTRIGVHSWSDRSDIGLSDIGVERAELVKGPAALSYSGGAFGGVLVFVDEKPASAGTILGRIGLGFHTNSRGLEGDIGLKGASPGGIFYSFNAGYMSHTSFIQGEDQDEVKKNTEEKEFATNSKWDNASAKVSVGMSKKWGISKLTYSFYQQHLGIIGLENTTLPIKSPGQITRHQRERTLDAPYQDITTGIIALENTLITGKSKLNLNLAFQDHDKNEYEPVPLTEDAEKLAIAMKLTTITYDLKWNSNPEKKFGLMIGTQGLSQENKNSGIRSNIPDVPALTEIAGYMLLRYDLSKVNVLGGLRYDVRSVELQGYQFTGGSDEPVHTASVGSLSDLTKDFTPVSGTLGISLHPVKDLNVKLNGAAGFTTPDHYQLGARGAYDGTGRFEVGNPNLDLSQNAEGDLSILWYSKTIDIGVSAFYNQVRNYIFLQNTGLKDTVKEAGTNGLLDTLDVYTFVQDDATLSGGEAILDLHPATLKWVGIRLCYAMMKGELGKGGNVPYIPANKFTGELTFRLAKLKWMRNPYLSMVFSNYAEQKNIADFELSSESYSLLDIRLGLQLPFAHQLVDLNIGITNILNTPYQSHLSTVRYMGIREMGRNVSIKIRIPFGIKGFNR